MKRISLICLAVCPFLANHCDAEFQVNTRSSYNQTCPAIAADAAGNFVIVWASYFQGVRSNDIFARILRQDGSPKGSEFQINAATSGNQTEPSVATDASGNFTVVWQGPGPDDEDIYARWFDPNGSAVGDEIRVNDYTPGGQLCPRVAADSASTCVIVWESSGTSQYPSKQSICARLLDNSGSSLCPEFSIDDSSYNCRYPDVGIDIAGNFVVVWIQDRTAKSVMARLYDPAGKPRTQPFEVSMTKFSSLTRPSVAMSPGGRFVITWDGDPKLASLDDIHARLYGANASPLTDQFAVNTNLTGPQQYPRAAINSRGDFVIVWQSEGTTGLDVFARRFNKLGQPLSDELQLNAYTQDDQKSPAVALTETGRLAAAWQSNGQDVSGYGIFAEIVAPIPSADLNADGVVNFLDYSLLAKEWLTTSASPTADLTADSNINALDLSTLFDYWLIPLTVVNSK